MHVALVLVTASTR